MTTTALTEQSMTKKQAADLFSQQIWCWGRDTLHSGGNLLVDYGMQRIEKPAGSNYPSLYTFKPSPTSRVILRGFGVFYGDDPWGGVFLRRYEFAPMLTPVANLLRPLWSSEDLPPLTLPHADQVSSCQRLLVDLTGWISRYETWIAENIGVDYRDETLQSWNAKRGTIIGANRLADVWQGLSSAVAGNPERFIRSVKVRSSDRRPPRGLVAG